jgi:SulP family sulfate permease
MQTTHSEPEPPQGWRRIYDFRNLKGDASGGLVAGIIALPLALAFGVQSGLGPAAGLYGAVAVGILAAVLGGTRTQASGPTGPMTVVAATVVVIAVERTGSVQAGLGIILLAFLAGGVFQVILGLLGVGKYVKYFPYPVISGFMTGVGVIIISLQLWPFFGSASPSSVLEVFTGILEPLGNINLGAVLVGAITVATYYLFPLITKAVPAVLVALIAGTGVAFFADLDVPLIGEIPGGIPEVQIGAMLSVAPEHYALVIQTGLTLALLGSIDSLLTSVIADNLTKTKHNSRRELIGQGIANLVAALFGGIPGAGATKGTVVNIQAGGVTRLSGTIHGVFLLAVLLGAGSLAAFIPLSVLAGLLIPVGLAIVDYKGLKHILRVPRADALVFVLVLVVTVFGNLIVAVGLGVVLASVLFMKKAGDLAASGVTLQAVDTETWDDEAKLLGRYGREVTIKHLEGPLFFGFTASFRDQLTAAARETETLILRMDRVPYIDQTGLYTLETMILDLRQRGVEVLFTGIREQPLDMLTRIKLVPDLIGEGHVFDSIDECLAWLEARPSAEQS